MWSDCLAVVLFALFCMAWRPWLGGLFRRFSWARFTWLKYTVAMFAVSGLTVYAGHYGAAAFALTLAFLFMWRGMGHGAMLRYPLGLDNDWLWALVYKLLPLSNGEEFIGQEDRGPKAVARWWLYAGVRYVGFALAVAAVVWFVRNAVVLFESEAHDGVSTWAVCLGFRHAAFAWPVVIAGALIPLWYWLLINAKDSLPYSWLLALGGVSKEEMESYWATNPGWPTGDDAFYEHNEYAHHFAEIAAGLTFGAGFACAVVV